MLTPGGQCATATSPELQDGGGPTTVDSPRAQQNSLGFRAFQLQDSTRSSIFFLDFLKQIHLVPGLVFPRVQGERTMMGWVYSWVDKKREQPTDWTVIENLRELI